MTNLIFLDSRDLIDIVDHARPLDHESFGEELRRRDAALVLTTTNVLETVPNVAQLESVVRLMRRLESVPHVFANHAEISPREFVEAVASESTGTVPSTPLALKSSFWRALVPDSIAQDPSRAEFHATLDQLPMADQLKLAFLDGERVSWNPEFSIALGDLLKAHREVLGVGPPNKNLFRHAVGRQLEHFGLRVQNLQGFADWMFRSPMVCPGWRLGHEAFQEFRLDQTAGVNGSGTRDLMHVYFLPYVRAATLDAQWRDYCFRAGRRLAKIGVAVPYLSNLYSNVEELLAAWPRDAA